MLKTLRGPALALAAALAMGCGSSQGNDEVELDLDPSATVISQSPVPFSPRYGGSGRGTFEGMPTTHILLSEPPLDNAGETNCGQFTLQSADRGLEVDIYGPLRAGTFPLVVMFGPDARPDARPASFAEVAFAGTRSWVGSLVIFEGAPSRNTDLRGRLEATSAAGETVDITFNVKNSGCYED